MAKIYHALGLNMHQPLGNLLALHNSVNTNKRWEAKQILWCYDRPTRMLEGYEDVARLHMSFSGTLLKQLEDPGIRETFNDVVDIEDFLDRYRRFNIEFLGTGLYHPVYPLIPPSDWDAQTAWYIGLGQHLLGRKEFRGFWPPEMGFCMEMIPMLKRHGYRYVIVDCWYIKPKREMRWEELRYRPYIARYDGEEIIVVPRDRELSNAQESGLDPGWFQHEVYERTKWCNFPRGDWNTGHHWGGDFTQWTGSLLQKKGWDEVCRASGYYQEVKRAFDKGHDAAEDPEEVRQLIIKAYDHILRAETSCNFYWGSRWVYRSFDDLEQAHYLLDTAMAKLRREQ